MESANALSIHPFLIASQISFDFTPKTPHCKIIVKLLKPYLSQFQPLSYLTHPHQRLNAASTIGLLIPLENGVKSLIFHFQLNL